MPAILVYLLKLSVCLAVVQLFYFLFLRRLTFYNWNRWYLAGYSLLSFFMSFVDISPQLNKHHLDNAEIIQWIPSVEAATAAPGSWLSAMSYWDWALAIVLAGAVIFFLRFIVRLASFLSLKRKASLVAKHPVSIYQVAGDVIPFSFGNAIFLNTEQHGEAALREIISHEMVHVKQKHSLDILFAECLCVVTWFNPFSWMLRHSIKQNLEFIVDQQVLANGCDKKQYQYLLLKVMGNRGFSIANNFNFSSLKKRIAMMNRLKSAKLHLIKFVFVLPVAALLLLSFRKEVKEKAVSAMENVGLMLSERTIVDDAKNSADVKGKTLVALVADTLPVAKKRSEPKSGQLVITRPGNDSTLSKPLLIVDGVEYGQISVEDLRINPPEDIDRVEVFKNDEALSQYGEKGKNGVIIITTKKARKTAAETDALIVKGRSLKPADTISVNVRQGSLRTNAETVTGSEPQARAGARSMGIRLRNGTTNPLLVLDGKIISQEELEQVKPEDINELRVFKDATATSLYGEKGKNGVVEITTKQKSNSNNSKTVNLSLSEPAKNLQ